MELKDIKTIESCKALAFDCIQTIEQQQTNLRLLQARIVELAEKTKEK
jgi:hypothetical protein